MLYLNFASLIKVTAPSNLTLTSVVFEFVWIMCFNPFPCYLTLTSVVFELYIKDADDFTERDLTLTSVVFECKVLSTCFKCWIKFNFNKCCIWIDEQLAEYKKQQDLTLTSVVFELPDILVNELKIYI